MSESKTEQYAKDMKAMDYQLDQALSIIDTQGRQLAAVRKWMATHARDPETREAVLQLSAAMLWADEDGGGT